ncbi:MAG: AAA family ATPase [Patescibacteria group bacterium]
MPADFSSIIGHEAQKQYLRRILDNQALAHGYCFSGPANLGKTTLARLLGAEILSVDVKELDQHPDFRTVSQMVDEKTGKIPNTISVETIRSIRSWMTLTSITGGRKVVIIENADLMTIAAQNALLKTLEEPSGEALMILIASDAERLLPTIISRVVHLHFSRVPRETLCDYLDSQGQKKEMAHALAGVAAGRPGLAVRLLTETVREDHLRLNQEALQFISNPLATRMKNVQDLTKEAQKDPEVLTRTIQVWHHLVHDALLSSLDCGRAFMSAEPSVAVEDVGKTKSPHDWARALNALSDAQNAINQNANPTIALEHFALAI